MTNTAFISILGLLLDIVGAYLLAKGVFFESVNTIVDKGIKIDVTRTSINNTNVDRAKRIAGRCNEQMFTRLGLSFLIIGFIAQIIGQILTQTLLTFIHSLIITLCIHLFIFSAFYIVRFYDEQMRQDSLLEFLDRITEDGFDLQGAINLPSGMPYSVIEESISLFLKRKLSFKKYGNIPKEKQTKVNWVVLESIWRREN